MSIAAFPRIYVRGEMSFDPSLSNNFDIYDPNRVELNRSAIPAGMTLDELRRQLPTALVQRPAEEGRSWNHFGTHHAIFEAVTVTGISLAPNELDTADPLVGKSIQLKGKLVDLNPATDNGTHVYFDKLQIGDFGGGLEARRSKRLICRYLNFARNLAESEAGFGAATRASGVWEVCFRKPDVRVMNPRGAPSLAALEQSFADPAVLGFSLRFHTYRTLYFQNGIRNQTPETPRTLEDLATLYADGRNFSNPAYAVIVGVISPWIANDHTGHPAGRFIAPAGPVPSLQAPLGVAFLEVDEQNSRATLDLGEVIPETTTSLEKASIGTLKLFVQAEGNQLELAALSPDAYARDAYESKAGLIDLELSQLNPAQWAIVHNGLMSIEAEGQPVLLERRYVVVVEDRDIYLDEGETASVLIRVMDRGVPAEAGTRVQVAEYDGTSEALVGVVSDLVVDASGEARLQIPAALEPGFRIFVFDAYQAGDTASAPRGEYNRSSDFHVMVRALPFDDALEQNTPDSQLTWSWIYENVLAVFGVLNPVMARTSNPAINRPLHDRATVEAHAARVKAVVHKGSIESSTYMPVTRDLSRGKRRLLQRWCDLVLSGNSSPESVERSSITVRTVSKRVFGEES